MTAALGQVLRACVHFAVGDHTKEHPDDTHRQDTRRPCATRSGAKREELADRSRVANADEQPRSPRSPNGPRSLSSTAESAEPRATGRASIESSRRCVGSTTTRRCLIQSGKPVGVFRTHADAPRVLIANSNLVPAWANWDHFHELDRKGLMMYGQMTAGSWIYIGTQGIVQGTYETFVEVARQHYGGDFAGRWILTAGLGGMGGAQPLAAVMAGASCLAVECQPSRIAMRLKTGYLDRQSNSLDEALEIIDRSCRDKTPISVGLLGNAAEVYPGAGAPGRTARRRYRPDLGPRSG